MNKKALKCIKKKHTSYKRFLSSKSGYDYLKYVKERNTCCKLLKKTRKDYEKHIAQESKTNPKMFWKYIQEKMKCNGGVSTLKKHDGTLVLEDYHKAETLNEYFTSVFTRECLDDVPGLDRCSYSDGISVNDLRITPLAVNNKLKELNTNKAQGPDKIPPYVLNEIRNELSLPLCVLFNKSLESGELPEDWKTAEVTAIFKKGNKSDPGNYRPVSLTCVLCKVLESLIRDVIVTYFTENNLYAKCQHGFRKKRSCVTQLLEVMEDITSLMDRGHSVDVIYMDFRKAFDTVPHRRLLVKLEAYGIGGNILKWIENFLTARLQYVRVGEKTSQKTQVLSGIPQGSILGPVLFTVFINDLPNDLQSTCRIFADDTKIFNKTENSHVIQEDDYRNGLRNGICILIYLNVVF